jgi:hypothetical protein
MECTQHIASIGLELKESSVSDFSFLKDVFVFIPSITRTCDVSIVRKYG